jgi:hypothetical protein
MELTKEEERILKGDYGIAKKIALEKLYKIGEAYDAEKFVKINSAHIAGISIKTLMKGGFQLLKDFEALNPKCEVLTTLNPTSIDLDNFSKLSAMADVAEKQMEVLRIFEKMGAIPTYSCTPYYLGNLPLYGQHIAWSETSAVIFANSILGARTVRESALTSLYASVVGRTCYYGLHKPENRLPTVSVKVSMNIDNFDYLDYSLLGYYVGKNVDPEAVPMFENLKSPTTDHLKSLGASMAIIGRVDLFHVRDITPEAILYKYPSPNNSINVSKEDLLKVKNEISTSSHDDVDLIALGCPHLSIQELCQVAQLLKGKKIRNNVTLWICTSKQMKIIADRMSITKVIENAGGKIMSDTCMVVAPVELLGFDKVMTNSAKAAYFLRYLVRREVSLDTLQGCCITAIKKS